MTDGAKGRVLPSTSLPLRPTDAVAAIVLVDSGYLLQLRDAKPEIFFPNLWGCFGGALEVGETEELALARELREEIGFDLTQARSSYFSRFVIDFAFAGKGQVFRSFYEVHATSAQVEGMRLREGAAMRVFEPGSLLSGEVSLTPFDSFALWLHINRGRLCR